MRQRLELGCAALCLALLTVTADAEPLEPYTATYLARGSGLKAELVVSLSKNGDGSWTYRTSTSGKGLAALVGSPTETSVFGLIDDAIVPREYRLDDGSDRRNRDSQFLFDWQSYRAHGTYESETRDLKIKPGVLDRHAYLVELSRDAFAGTIPESYDVVSGGAIKTYHITVEGDETITTKDAGSFKTLKLSQQREGSSRTTYYWLAKDLRYLPVRIEQYRKGKRKSRADLASVDGL